MVPVEPELDWKEAHAYSHEIAERVARQRRIAI